MIYIIKYLTRSQNLENDLGNDITEIPCLIIYYYNIHKFSKPLDNHWTK